VPLPGVEPGDILTLLLRELPLPIWPQGHCLVLPAGFEPAPSPHLEASPRYKLGVLPLNYRSMKRKTLA